MSETVVLQGNAKINLSLDVLGKRQDGYHEVSMVMQSVSLADEIILQEAKDISLTVDVSGLEADSRNLAWRAAELVRQKCAISKGVSITLRKKIPLAAGLAGGSADAAAVLRGVNKLWAAGLTQQELLELGAQLGSDVPFCLLGGTRLATGRGTKLEELSAMPVCGVILAKLPVAVSTAWVYGQFAADRVKRRPDLPGMRIALQKGSLEGIASRLCNVLESVTITEHPVIQKLKEDMLRQGAMASLMSGSGPTVFALTKNEEAASDVAERLRCSWGDRVSIFTAKTVMKVDGE
nr:4-(cytidine 5'-diphospho)-2-C-methyl-D-erythritol kinase [uncultured Anaeromusa sp.]